MQAQAVVLLSLLSFVLILYSLGLKVPMPGTFHSYLKFAYGSFFKPHTGDGSGNQQDALESFYEYQADAYDTTRTTLLRGRDDMIRLVAAQLRHRKCSRKPVWIDVRSKPPSSHVQSADQDLCRLAAAQVGTSSRWASISMFPASSTLSTSST